MFGNKLKAILYLMKPWFYNIPVYFGQLHVMIQPRTSDQVGNIFNSTS